MYNCEKSKLKFDSQYNDLNYPPFSSSYFLKKPLKTHHSKSYHNEDISLFTSTTTTTKTPQIRAKPFEDEKISSIRRACLVEKCMEKRAQKTTSSSTLLEEFDLFSSNTSTNTTTSSSSSDETDYSVSSNPKQNSLSTCFAPPRPKSIKIHSIKPEFLNRFSQENDQHFIKIRSRAAKVCSNLKNLKQPISPGVRLTSFINSLFTKDGKTSSKNGRKQMKTDENTSTSTRSSASSFSRSCLMRKNKKYPDDGMKPTVKFCPVSVVVDDSQPCGYKSLQEEKSSLSKGYEGLKKLNELDKEISDIAIKQHQKKLEDVGLDLLSGYWDARLNKSYDLSSKIKGDNQGVNYAQHENEDHDNDYDDGFSCSSSDLFELDHLSLIGDELPVYETTQVDNKIM